MDFIDSHILAYAEAHSSPESPLLRQINRDTHAEVLSPRMLSGHLQGRALSMICSMIKPSCIVEIGTYTGYSALCMAEHLAQDGVLYTIDINEELEPRVRAYLDQSPLGDKIQYIVGDALTVLDSLEVQIDLVFIDADKKNYIHYLDKVLHKVKEGGYIVADNVLWSGKVVGDYPKDKELEVIKAYNQKVLHHPQLEVVLLPIRDGLSIARKLHS